MKKANFREEIEQLERAIGNDPRPALRRQALTEALATIRSIILEEPCLLQEVLLTLTTDVQEWRWPLSIHTPRERAQREQTTQEAMRKRRESWTPSEIEKWQKKALLKLVAAIQQEAQRWMTPKGH